MDISALQTVYVAILEDWSSDTEAFVFARSEDAIEWSRTQIRSLDLDDLDETLTPSMIDAGWLYYGRCSGEGVSLLVVPAPLRLSAEREEASRD